MEYQVTVLLLGRVVVLDHKFSPIEDSIAKNESKEKEVLTYMESLDLLNRKTRFQKFLKKRLYFLLPYTVDSILSAFTHLLHALAS